MGKKIFHVDCRWEMCGTYVFRADTPEEAAQKAHQMEECPEDGTYIDDSFKVDGVRRVQ